MCYVTLYHGSPKSNALKIIETGTLESNCERIWNEAFHDINGTHLNTTNGYCYLTDKIGMAAFYGNSARICRDNGDDAYYIFRVRLPRKVLLQDTDELRMNYGIVDSGLSAEESLSICHSVSVNFPINTCSYKLEYIEVLTGKGNFELLSLIRELSSKRRLSEGEPRDIVERIGELAKWKPVYCQKENSYKKEI